MRQQAYSEEVKEAIIECLKVKAFSQNKWLTLRF